jgi:heme/copper-type cytochrome/quinol oxidase subunit 3
VLDGEWAEVLEPPSQSGKPVLLALTLAVMFTMALLEHWVVAGVVAGVAALVIVWWHADEGEAAVLRTGSLPIGVWGMVMLVLAEGTLLVLAVGSYWYLRFRDSPWPPPGVPDPKVLLPLILTGVLIAAAAPVVLAARAGQAGRVSMARGLLALALVLQLGYLAAQVLLFRHDLLDFGPGDHAYGSAYFMLLALHHAHVVAGVVFSAALLSRLAGGLTSYRVTGLRAAALYWCFVSALAVPVVLTQVSPGL